MRRHVLDLSAELRRRGWEVAVAGPGMAKDLPVPTLPGPGQGKARESLRALLEDEKPVILHVHGWTALSLALSVKPALPLFFTAHTLLPPWESPLRRLGVLHLLRKAREKEILFFAVSKAVGEELLAAGVPEENVVVLPPGVKVPLREEGEKEGLPLPPPGVLRIGVASRFSREKGLDVLLCALSRLPRGAPWHLFLAGSGPLEGDLKRRVKRYGLEGQVTFLGFRPSLAGFYEAIHLLAVPSRQEGLGLSALEAMAAGKPVVASRVGGLPEVVVDGETGFLLPPGDCRAWAQGLEAILHLPRARLEAMGQAGRARAARWPFDGVVDRVEEAYRLR